jgi:hypothetical protein
VCTLHSSFIYLNKYTHAELLLGILVSQKHSLNLHDVSFILFIKYDEERTCCIRTKAKSYFFSPSNYKISLIFNPTRGPSNC